MRRGILFLIILAVLVVFAWQVVLKPKSKTSTKTTKKTKTDSTAVTTKRPKKAGRLKRLTKEEKKAEKERLRAEKKRRKQELRRQKREKRLAQKSARKRGSKRTKKGYQAYVLQAIVWFDVGPSYAMIDGRRYEVGDEVSGRKILAIKQDQIAVSYRGTQNVVRMGESLLPKGYFGTERRRR